MKKSILAVFLVALLSSCAPSVYQVYDKYNDDPQLERTKIPSGSWRFVGLFTKDKNIKALSESINSIDIVNYGADNNSEFKQMLLRSLRAGGYRKVLKDKEKKTGAQFFVKKGLRKVREFHVLRNENEKLSLISVSGEFKFSDLEKVYELIKNEKGGREYLKKLRIKIS